MRMTEQGSVNVTALRAQLEDKLAFHANSTSNSNSSLASHEESGDRSHLGCYADSISNLEEISSASPIESPPVPPHKSKENETNGVEDDLPPIPVRVRPHQTTNSTNGIEPSPTRPKPLISAKPPIAPKPKKIPSQLNLASNSEKEAFASTPMEVGHSPVTPTILVSEPEECRSVNVAEGDVSMSEKLAGIVASTDTVRERARQFEENGNGCLPIQPVIKRKESTTSTTDNNNRPLSSVSTLSLTSYGQSLSDSDTDDERPAEMIRKQINRSSSAKLPGRRPSVSFNGDAHEKIMDELKRQGIGRSSNSYQGLFKKRVETQSPRSRRAAMESGRTDPPPRPPAPAASAMADRAATAEEGENRIPEDVGRLREDRTSRVPELTLSFASSVSDESQMKDHRGDSFISDRSSVVTNSSENEAVLDYQTGDPDEDKRLKKLHYAANEFYTVQKSFLKYLTEMGEVYPQYVVEYGKRIGKDLLAVPIGMKVHPVNQLKDYFNILIPIHRILIEQFATQTANWTSLSPSMSDVILKHGDFLKACRPFLMEKARLATDLTRLREENKEFDQATLAFEQKVFHRGVGAVVQQLDQVHQNFMRYKILMMSYRNYLKEGSEEFTRANEAITKLEKIAQTVNEAMGLPTNDELLNLYDRFQCQFDVFYPGRILIRQGEVVKQARNKILPRYLVLFSDCLWVCRVASVMTSSGLFDLNRSYRIPVETIRTDISEHEDFEKHLGIKSKEYSVNLILSSVREREHWNRDILNAREQKRNYKRRMSEAQDKQRRQSTGTPVLNLTSDANLIENGQAEEATPTDSAARLSLRFSERQSRSLSPDDTPSQSQPDTPVDEERPGPSMSRPVLRTNTKRRIRRAEKDKPLWLPDDSSTRCLMEGCGSVFSLLNRRHHCRDCGFLICSSCSGRAPLSKYDFKKELVCPECFLTIKKKYTDGTLFPAHLLSTTSDGHYRVRIAKGRRGNQVQVDPRSLFEIPVNEGLKRLRIQDRVKQKDGLVFGKVYVKTRKGGELVRYAQLMDGMILRFFKATYDDEPCEQHVIHGFSLKETQLEEGGTLFELVHRNQIRTDRKEHVVMFRVELEKSRQKWSTALHEGLSLTNQSPPTP